MLCKTEKKEYINNECSYLAKKLADSKTTEECIDLLAQFKLYSHYIDVSQYINECYEIIYQSALDFMRVNNISSKEMAKKRLQHCIDWKDSKDLLVNINEQIKKLEQREETFGKIREGFWHLLFLVGIIFLIILIMSRI